SVTWVPQFVQKAIRKPGYHGPSGPIWGAEFAEYSSCLNPTVNVRSLRLRLDGAVAEDRGHRGRRRPPRLAAVCVAAERLGSRGAEDRRGRAPFLAQRQA